MKKLFFIVVCALVFTGCADKNRVNYSEVKNSNCSAINFISVLAVRPDVKEIIDLRREDQRTYENTLFSTKEYCSMVNKDISSIINDYEIRTQYSNSMSYKNGIVTIRPSGKTYIALENSFNFMAINKNHSLKHFKNAEKVKLGDKYLSLEVLNNYTDESHPFTIGMNIYGKGNEILEQSIFSLNGKKNIFIFDEYIISF